MIGLSSRPFDSASPWMIAMSVAFHGALAVAIVVVSSAALRPHKAREEIISHVKLVQPTMGTMAAEKLQAVTDTNAEPLALEETVAPQEPAKAPEAPRETIRSRSVAAPSKDLIPLAKRRTPPKRLAAPKEQPKKEEPKTKPAEAKTEKAKPAKPESPQSFLEKRMAAIRKDLEDKKREGSTGAGNQGVAAGSGKADEELARWLEQVRSAINAHWALFSQERRQAKVTVIGAKIADDGTLTTAAVDKASGDPVFDRSAMRAVYQAAPFPAVPVSARETIRKEGGLALRFTPGGMQ
jgi:TonB family protein